MRTSAFVFWFGVMDRVLLVPSVFLYLQISEAQTAMELDGPGPKRRRDLSEVWTIDTAGWIAVVRVIGRVEHIHARLQPDLLAQLEILRD
jgi:hypothetical protein